MAIHLPYPSSMASSMPSSNGHLNDDSNAFFESFEQSNDTLFDSDCLALSGPDQLMISHSNQSSSVATKGGDDWFWICNECTFTNNERISNDRCTLCDAKRFEELMTPFGDIDDVDDGDGDEADDANDDDDGNGQKVMSLRIEAIEDIGGGGDDLTMTPTLTPIESPDDHGDHSWFAVDTDSVEQQSSPSVDHFDAVLSVVVGHAPSHKAAITVLKSLKKITQRVSDEKPKYRVLDVRSEGVQSKLLGFEGSFEFLQFLGYSLDPSQSRLQCLKHPPQQLLDEVIVLIDGHLTVQREKLVLFRRKRRRHRHRRHKHTVDDAVADGGADEVDPDDIAAADEEEEAEEAVRWDSGGFTLAQLVGLLTHETLEDSSAVKVLLLCHRCFSSSTELLEAMRKRFFVPPPPEAEEWSEAEVIWWCRCIQRPVQQKCVFMLCQWITA